MLSRWIPLLALVATLATAAWHVVPCHWIATAADPEFTGWVAPLSNRFTDGMVLYTDGGHSPLPPLPFVLLHALGRGEAIWLTESAANMAALAIMTLLIYAALARAIGRPLAFLAAIGALPIFLNCPKSLAYDAVAQAFVAGFGLAMVRWAQAPRPRNLVVAACVGAAMLLSKHNTAAGALVGGAIVVTFLPRDLAWRERALALAGLTAGTLVATIVLLLALFPFASASGFVHDVVLNGSEPKGGGVHLLEKLADTGHEILAMLPWLFLCGAALVAIGGRARAVPWWSAVVATAAGAVGVATVVTAPTPPSFYFWPRSMLLGDAPWWTVQVGLCAALVGLGVALARGRSGAVVGLAVLTAVWFPAAVTHSLSVATFRWSYDTNPLIALTVAWPLLAAASLGPALVFAALAAMLQLGLWSSLGPAVAHWRSCTEEWPEVPALAGARMPARAAGLRLLIGRVQMLAPRPDDRVLLLPNDPDVEAMLRRPRPAVSSLILYVDQYWDRYVDDDLARLRADPPAVVLMGPRLSRGYQLGAHGRGLRADRLIEGVTRELLPQYQLAGVQKLITANGGHDAIQIYVRKPTP